MQSSEIIKESKDQTTPLCEHFGVCGGCAFQNYSYDKQLIEKQNQINDLFSRIAKIANPPIKPIIGCKDQYYYRNKMEFAYSSNRWIENLNPELEEKNTIALGLHVKNRFDKIVDIADCYINSKISNKIFKFLKEDPKLTLISKS